MYISDDIFYIGVNDHRIDLFEGQYPGPHGMSYNSYVIMDEKIAVMDTVDAGFTEEWLLKLSSVLSGSNAVFSGCIGTCSSFMVFTGFSTGGFSTDGFSTGVPQFSQNRSPAFNSYPQFVQNIEAPFSVRTLADNRRAADHRQILSMCRNIFMNDLCFYAISITQRFSVCQTIIHPSPV